MDFSLERLQRYSWHQSHDQATVLLLVPYDTLPEDISVIIERNYLVAGIRGQPPIIKGRLYATVDTTNSSWQLEPRASPGRGRTISSTSSHSSFALVSDHDLSSFTAGSLESESEDYADVMHSPVLSSPSSNDERAGVAPRLRDDFVMPHISAFSSPRAGPSITSSLSSTESLQHTIKSGRLLTLHLEKAESIIWPSLIVGSVPVSLSPVILLPPPWQDVELHINEEKYNMDPTSLSLIAVDILDIRQDRNEAFEYFIRAWHQSRIPLSTLRLVAAYAPLHSTTPLSADSHPHGSSPYFINRLGGPVGQAQLYLEAGLLYLEGTASLLLTSSATALSSIRSSEPFHHPSLRESGTETWRRDRETARRYFERAKTLDPTLEVPVLPSDGSPEEWGMERERGRSVKSAKSSAPASVSAASSKYEHEREESVTVIASRRRKKERTAAEETLHVESSNSDLWYLYLPGVVGAILAVGVVGALSLTSWRKSQN